MTKHPKTLNHQHQNSHRKPSRRGIASIDAAGKSGRPGISPEHDPQPAVDISAPEYDRTTIDERPVSMKPITAPVLSVNKNEPRTMCLYRLSWRSYARLCTVISMCIGFASSIAFFLLAFVFNVEFSVQIGNVSIGGRLFSTVAVFAGPFFSGAIGFASSFITHPLFTQILKRFSGLPLTGQWLDSAKHDVRG